MEQSSPAAPQDFRGGCDARVAADKQQRTLDADQRAKNRLIVKRCYYKKLNMLNNLRREVGALEAQYERLLEAQHLQDAQPTSPSEQQPDNSTTTAAVHRACVQLLQLQSALRKENRELRRLEEQYLSMEKQVRQLWGAQNKLVAAAQQAQELKRINPAITVNPMTLEDCLEIARSAHHEIDAYRASQNCFSTGSSLFGWRDRHKLETDKLTFSLEKVFHGHSMEKVSSATWDVLSQPHHVANIYPRDVKVHFHVTQRLNENTVIYYHTLERQDSDVRVRAFILAMRVDLGAGRGSMVLYRGLDPKRYLQYDGRPSTRDRRGRKKLEPQKEDVWIDTFIWGIFEREGPHGEHCKDDFGGVIQGTALATAGYWCLEILQIAMRIEALVIGPQVLLRQ